MRPPNAGTFWLIMQSVILAVLLLRCGIGWRLGAVFAGFEIVYVCENTGVQLSRIGCVPAHLSPLAESLSYMLMISGTLILLLFLPDRPGFPSLRRRIPSPLWRTLGLTVMTLGMLLHSGTVVLLILWLVMTRESLSLVHTRNEEDF